MLLNVLFVWIFCVPISYILYKIIDAIVCPNNKVIRNSNYYQGLMIVIYAAPIAVITMFFIILSFLIFNIGNYFYYFMKNFLWKLEVEGLI